MTCTHLTPDELVLIESYAKINQSVAKTAQILQRSRQTIHNVYSYLKEVHIALDYYQNYKKINQNVGEILSFCQWNKKSMFEPGLVKGGLLMG